MSEKNRHEIFDQYLGLIKVATENQSLSGNILELLHTQGQMLGLSLEEMLALDKLASSLNKAKEKQATLYSDLLSEYKQALGIFEKKTDCRTVTAI